VLPLLFAAHGLTVADIGIIKAVDPLTWSAGQLGTGALSDRIGRRPLIASGMVVQAIALALIASGQPSTYVSGVAGAVLLGLGTAMVYPALLAAAADTAMPATRAPRSGGIASGATSGIPRARCSPAPSAACSVWCGLWSSAPRSHSRRDCLPHYS
jgi:MFS family permease